VSRPVISTFAASRPRSHGSPVVQQNRLPWPFDSHTWRSPRAELADAAHPIRRSQGRRDPGAPSRGRSAAPTQPTPHPDVDRPRAPQRAQQTAPYLVARAAARLTQNPAALARPPRHPPLDLPQTTTRPPTHPGADPGPGAADGSREPHLGLPTHPGRTSRTRPPRGRLHRLDDPQGRGHRSRPAAVRPDPGDSSSPRRPPRSSRSTSPTSTPSSSAASTCSSRSSTAPAACTSPGLPPTPPDPESPNRPATCS
jgi:hypothetical protein